MKPVKFLFLSFTVLFIQQLTSSCTCILTGSDAIKGNGVNIKKDRVVSSFNTIKVSSGMYVYLIQGDQPGVKIEGEENLINAITTEVKDSVLNIFPNKSIQTTKNMNIYVTFKYIKAITLSSGSSMTGEKNISLESMDMTVVSGSSLDCSFTLKKLSCNLSSGCSVKLTGETDECDLKVSSGSDFKGNNLKIKNCRVTVSSGSNVHINVSDELTATSSSGSDLNCSGNPKKRNINSSIGSEINFNDN